MAEMSEYTNGQFSWVDLVAHDMTQAQRFYEQVFGWTTALQDTQGGSPYAFFEKNGKQVAGIGQMNEEMKQQGIPSTWNNYINVDDVEATTAKAAELGATVTVPVMQVLDAGLLSFFQDPTGAHVGLWQADKHRGSQLVNEPGSLCWNELATTDLEKSKEFYGQLFQWEFTPNEDAPTDYDIIWNNGRENGGMMQMTAEWQGVPPHWMVYFAVNDVDQTAAAVQQAGGNVCVPPFDTPVGRIAVMDDPSHAVFSVIKLSK